MLYQKKEKQKNMVQKRELANEWVKKWRKNGKRHISSDEESVIHKIINCSEVHRWTQNVLNRN